MFAAFMQHFCVDNIDIHNIECITSFDPWYWQCWHCQHIFAHNFLNIQQIFNPKKVLECWESGLYLYHQILYMLILSMQVIRFLMHSMPKYTGNVDTVDSELSKIFLGLKIHWIIRKLWAKMYLQCWHSQYKGSKDAMHSILESCCLYRD